MRRLVPLVLVLSALLVPAGPALGDDGQYPAVSGDRGSARCQGKPATIVGRPGQARLVGTKRDDVIISNGARSVVAGRGDDRICVTRGSTSVLARGGDDVVKVLSKQYQRVSAQLGGGEDTFIGGPHSDQVTGGSYGGDSMDQFGDDNKRDLIRTGGGRDYVIAGGSDGLADRIDLGSGTDTVELRADRAIDGGRVIGGPGSDLLRVTPTIDAGPVVIDATTGNATENGSPFLAFDDLEQYQFRFEPDTSVTFLGSARDEYAHLPGGVLHGDLGAGDDAIVGVFGPLGTQEDLSGGPGNDHLVLEGSAVTFDAAGGSAAGGPTHGSATYDGFEWLHGIGETVSMAGSATSETLVAYGCAVTVTGLGGDDTLVSYAGPGAADEFGCEATSSELAGGQGDDDLTGGNGADVLLGGEGQDRADGRRGEDVCEAEIRLRCEA